MWLWSYPCLRPCHLYVILYNDSLVIASIVAMILSMSQTVPSICYIIQWLSCNIQYCGHDPICLRQCHVYVILYNDSLVIFSIVAVVWRYLVYSRCNSNRIVNNQWCLLYVNLTQCWENVVHCNDQNKWHYIIKFLFFHDLQVCFSDEISVVIPYLSLLHAWQVQGQYFVFRTGGRWYTLWSHFVFTFKVLVKTDKMEMHNYIFKLCFRLCKSNNM